MSDCNDAVLYVRNSSPECKKSEEYLLSKGIDFAKKDIGDPAVWRELKTLGGSKSVPRFVAGGESYSGMDDILAYVDSFAK